jgi:hypothetical protein
VRQRYRSQRFDVRDLRAYVDAKRADSQQSGRREVNDGVPVCGDGAE